MNNLLITEFCYLSDFEGLENADKMLIDREGETFPEEIPIAQFTSVNDFEVINHLN